MDRGGVKSWDPGTRKQRQLSSLPKHGLGPMFCSPDGLWMAIAGNEMGFDTDIHIWGLKGQEIYNLSGHTGLVREASWSPDGRRLISASIDGTVKVWDTASWQELLTLRGKPGVGFQAVAFSPDDWRIAASQGDTVRIWNAMRQTENDRRGGAILKK